jgi:hypothetical protein
MSAAIHGSSPEWTSQDLRDSYGLNEAECAEAHAVIREFGLVDIALERFEGRVDVAYVFGWVLRNAGDGDDSGLGSRSGERRRTRLG